MERFTPSHTLYAILKSMENLCFGKEGYFHILVFYMSYFINEIENIPPVFPYVIETLVDVEREIAWNLCFYNCMETWRMFSIS